MENINEKELGKVIRLKRKEKRMTQSDLGEAIDSSVFTISKAESGYTDLTLKYFLKICFTLEADPLELLVHGIYEDEDKISLSKSFLESNEHQKELIFKLLNLIKEHEL